MANSGSYHHLILNSDSELIELIGGEDKGTEKEDLKNEKSDNFILELCNSKIENLLSGFNRSHANIFIAIHHPEITTPPPQSILF